jgi:dTDP-4-amino-4,6-dideoxygalactose transaminase
MSNVCAAIGRGQLEILDKHVALRRSNYTFYSKLFSDIPGVSFVDEPAGSFANRWLTTILIDPAKTGGITRETLRLAFLDENIESRPLWKPMHLQPVFQSARAYTNGVSEALFDQGLCLPSGSNLTDHERTRIAEVIERVFRAN